MRQFRNAFLMPGFAALVLAGCSKDDNGGTDNGGSTGAGDKYFISATTGSGTTAFTYTLAVPDLEKDTTVTTQYPGTIENIGSYTQYGYNGTKALAAIYYQQGNPAPGAVFQLDAAGTLKKMDEFVLDRGFNTLGSYSKYLIAAANGETLTGANDGKAGSVFYFVDLENNNTITAKAIVAEKFIGDRTAAFVGFADAGDGNFFSSVMLTAPTGGTAVTMDSVWIAKLDADLNVVKIYQDNRIGYSAGTFRSARYSQIANDASGNTYVFSTGYGTSTKKAGALLIRKGAADFDAAYYFDIETVAEGYKFRKVWNITEDYFLLEMYNAAGVPASQGAATQYAVARMSTKEFKWVRTNFPTVDEITSAGWPFTADGKAYVSIVTANTNPTVYSIDPKQTGAVLTAKKGISVAGVTALPGLGKLSPQQ